VAELTFTEVPKLNNQRPGRISVFHPESNKLTNNLTMEIEFKASQLLNLDQDYYQCLCSTNFSRQAKIMRRGGTSKPTTNDSNPTNMHFVFVTISHWSQKPQAAATKTRQIRFDRAFPHRNPHPIRSDGKSTDAIASPKQSH
jgi:hypothetical protein